MSEIRVDTISEKTSANGVAVDGVTLKDGGGTFTSPVLVPDGSTSAVSLGNDGDPNTGIYFQAADSLGLVLGGSRKLSATSAGVAIENGTLSAKGGAVFNEDSADVDFRVESNGDANMLFVDGGNNRVGVGTASPSAVCEIVGADGDQLVLDNAGNRFTQLTFNNNNTQKAAIWHDETNDNFESWASSGYSNRSYANGHVVLTMNASDAHLSHDNNRRWNFNGSDFSPNYDNAQDIGTGSKRIRKLYTYAVDNASDARLKTTLTALTTNEINASKLLAKEIGTYKWLADVSEKGDNARINVGVTAQKVIEIMESCGLTALDYNLVHYDTWDAVEEIKETNVGIETTVQEAKSAGDMYSIEYTQLNQFIAAGFNARLTALEDA